ncbi:hypothetical protein [Streptosporangium sp. NPDC003464]
MLHHRFSGAAGEVGPLDGGFSRSGDVLLDPLRRALGPLCRAYAGHQAVRPR